MKEKIKILIGFIRDGKAGGVDKFLLNLLDNIDMQKYRIDFLTSSKNIPLEESLNRRNVRLYEVCPASSPARQYKEIRTIMSENGYDVFYLNISTAIPCTGMIAARREGVRVRIVHSHSAGLDIDRIVARMIMRFLHMIGKQIISREANIYITCSQKAGEWLYARRARRSSDFYVIHNAVSPEKFVFCQEVRDKMRKKYAVENRIVIIQIGNFTYQKNHQFTIDIFREVVKENPDYVLWLLGEGKKRQDIEKLVKQSQLENHVYFMGQVSNVGDFLQASDCFILPSRFEGYPISALETQACGLPSLLSDKITKECAVNVDCRFLPLNKNVWKRELLKINFKDRKNSQEIFRGKTEAELYGQIEKIWNTRCEND